MTRPDNDSDIEDRRLEAWLAAAPWPPASPAFCERVMRAIESRPLPWRLRLRRFFLAPHMLNWNVAGAATAFALVLSVGLGLMLWSRAPGPATMIGTAAAPAGTMTVRFELAMPQARQVRLAGDFTQWQARVVLRKQADGTWVAEVPLPPGDHEYMFVVDGERWLTDPRAARYRDDGFGSRNAVIAVPSV